MFVCRVLRGFSLPAVRTVGSLALLGISILGAGLGCSRSSSSSIFGFEVESVSAETGPGLGDDVIRLEFTRDADPVGAVDPANYALESPIGNSIPLARATLIYSAADRTVTFAFDRTGDLSLNLSALSSFRVEVVGDLRSFVGNFELTSNRDGEGVVGGSPNPPPALLSIFPDNGPTSGGTVVTLHGTGFTNSTDTVIQFGGGGAATTANVLSGETATVLSPPDVERSVQIRMQNPNGVSASGSAAFRYLLPVPLINAPLALQVGVQPQSASLADLDEDGNLDLIVAHFGSDTVLVRRGLGTGKFTGATTLVLNDNAGANTVRAADLNGDGALDLIVTKANNGNFWTYLNEGIVDGNLTFSDNVRTRVGRIPEGFCVGHFNGDPWLDVAVVNKGDGTISVCLGDGTGAFPTVNTTPVNILSPVDVASADVDGDGLIDLVTANLDSNGSVTVWTGDGKGDFTRAADFPTQGVRCQSIQLVDVIGDDSLDVVVANNLSSDVSILPGDGAGGFGVATVLPSADGPIEAVVTDFDQDGNQDVAVSCRNDRLISIHMGLGGGDFAEPQFFSAGSDPFDLQAGDLNGDGRPDLVAPNRGSRRCAFFLSGDTGFLSPVATDVATSAKRLVSADFDSDGHLDFATLGIELRGEDPAGSVRLLMGRPEGGFDVIPGPSTDVSMEDLEVGDVNNDGYPDLVTALTDIFSVGIHFNNGDGTFAEMLTQIVGPRPVLSRLGDVNQDGFLDLLAVREFPGGIFLWFGDGTGAFRDGGFLMAGSDPLNGVAVVDFNGDGIVDVGFGQERAQVGAVGYFVGTGGGAFDGFVQTDAREQPKDIGSADLNQDGHPDLISAGQVGSAGFVRILLNDGTGQFPSVDEQIRLMVGAAPRSLDLVDLDGDGATDIVVGNSGSDTVLALLINPEDVGNPSQTLEFVTGARPFDVVAGDLDGDSVPDLAAVNFGPGSVEVFSSRR